MKERSIQASFRSLLARRAAMAASPAIKPHGCRYPAAGAANIRIRQSNPKQMVIEFLAPEDFEVEAVEVTVYDSSDLDTRQPIALAVPFDDSSKKTRLIRTEPRIEKVELFSYSDLKEWPFDVYCSVSQLCAPPLTAARLHLLPERVVPRLWMTNPDAKGPYKADPPTMTRQH